MSHRFPPLARWALCLCATSLVALSLGLFTARADEPDVGVLGLTPTDPVTTGAVGTGAPGLSEATTPITVPGAVPPGDMPGLDLLWSTQVVGSPGMPPQLDAYGKPVPVAALPPDAPPAPRNAIEEAKIARARGTVAAARAGEVGQPKVPASQVDQQAARAGEVGQPAMHPSSTGSMAADGKAPSDAALTLRPDPAAGLITVPPPRQEAGPLVLTDAEKAKLGKGGRQ